VRSSVLASRAPSPASRAPSPLRSPVLQTNDKLLSPASPTFDDKAFLPSSTEKDKIPHPHPETDGETTETLHTLTVPAVLPFSYELRTSFERPQTQQPGLIDPDTFEEGYAEPRGVAIVDVSLGMEGQWDVEVVGIGFELSVSELGCMGNRTDQECSQSGSSYVVLDDTLVANADLFPMGRSRLVTFGICLTELQSGPRAIVLPRHCAYKHTSTKVRTILLKPRIRTYRLELSGFNGNGEQVSALPCTS
jgi:hypothetical protein